MQSSTWRSRAKSKGKISLMSMSRGNTHVEARGNYIKKDCIYVSLFYAFDAKKANEDFILESREQFSEAGRFFRPINFSSLCWRESFYDLQLINLRLPSKDSSFFSLGWVIKKKRRRKKEKLSSVTCDCVPVFLCFRFKKKTCDEYLHTEFQQIPKRIRRRNEQANRK